LNWFKFCTVCRTGAGVHFVAAGSAKQCKTVDVSEHFSDTAQEKSKQTTFKPFPPKKRKRSHYLRRYFYTPFNEKQFWNISYK
jgi:hypothetical protein